MCYHGVMSAWGWGLDQREPDSRLRGRRKAEVCLRADLPRRARFAMVRAMCARCAAVHILPGIGARRKQSVGDEN